MSDELRQKAVALRKKLGLSQPKLAAKLGCSVNTISRYEVGVTTVTKQNIYALYGLFYCEQMGIEI